MLAFYLGYYSTYKSVNRTKLFMKDGEATPVFTMGQLRNLHFESHGAEVYRARRRENQHVGSDPLYDLNPTSALASVLVTGIWNRHELALKAKG